jgi:lysophospholipase L1-like esterase
VTERHPGNRSRLGFELTALALIAVVVAVVGGSALLGSGGNSAAPSPAMTQAATQSQANAQSTPPTATGAISSTATGATSSATPGANPISPPLPAMLAAIGDSYSQAYDVSPTLPPGHDNVAYSWVLGTGVNDGVFSLLERFQALGASPTVVDAATSGKKIADAVRQARLVVAAAKQLPTGATVFVTFELGTNDLCDDPQTGTSVFLTQLRAAAAVLEAGLPPGSRILMLSVPDFIHFRAITQANATTRAFFASTSHWRKCAPFLGSRSRTPLSQASATLASYDKSLVAVCDEIEATYGPSGTLHCTRDGPGLAETDFAVADLSSVDYFHPSVLGQASMAEAAWRLGYWGQVPLPADSLQ